MKSKELFIAWLITFITGIFCAYMWIKRDYEIIELQEVVKSREAEIIRLINKGSK